MSYMSRNMKETSNWTTEIKVNPHWSRVPLTSLVRVSWHPTLRYIIYSTHYYEDWVILIIRVHVYLFRLCIQQHFFLSFYRSKQAKGWALRTASDGFSDWDRFIQLLELTWFKIIELIFTINITDKLHFENTYYVLKNFKEWKLPNEINAFHSYLLCVCVFLNRFDIINQESIDWYSVAELLLKVTHPVKGWHHCIWSKDCSYT